MDNFFHDEKTRVSTFTPRDLTSVLLLFSRACVPQSFLVIRTVFDSGSTFGLPAFLRDSVSSSLLAYRERNRKPVPRSLFSSGSFFSKFVTRPLSPILGRRGYFAAPQTPPSFVHIHQKFDLIPEIGETVPILPEGGKKHLSSKPSLHHAPPFSAPRNCTFPPAAAFFADARCIPRFPGLVK